MTRPDIFKACSCCGQTFNATCGAAKFCSDKCHIRASVKDVGGCWEWQAGCDKDGYGVVRMRGRRRFKAHRAAWMLFRGKLEEGMMVCHSCDNPKCCNPDHLFLGTALDNKSDCIGKDRHVRGERMFWKAKLNASDVQAIRSDPRNAATIANQYGITKESVYNIRSGKTWKHI